MGTLVWNRSAVRRRRGCRSGLPDVTQSVPGSSFPRGAALRTRVKRAVPCSACSAKFPATSNAFCARYEWQRGEDWLNKRLTSWFNHRFLGRAKQLFPCGQDHRPFDGRVAARGIDHLVFSGDATALGFESEIRRAAEILRVGEQPIPGFAIPGNHDYCTRSAAASGHFENYFAKWQQGRRIGEHCYPFAQQAGPAWLIGVNAATGNRSPINAGGSVGTEQLQRLQQLLDSLEPGFRILVLHFPFCLADGFARTVLSRPARSRCLARSRPGRRRPPLAARASPFAVLFPAAKQGARFPSSAPAPRRRMASGLTANTTIEGNSLQAVRREYDPSEGRFRDAETFALQLDVVR